MQFQRPWMGTVPGITAATLRAALLVAMLLTLGMTPALGGQFNPLKPLPANPPRQETTLPSPKGERLPGDTMDDAIPILSLPFVGTGNTCSYADDYALMCPYGNSAPDVVYAFTPEEEMNISIRLCESGYDTALFVYHTEFSSYTLVGCNDDGCGPDGYRSFIEPVHVQPERTYYIIVDGYTNACGDYVLQVEDLGLCIPECTEIWELEGEPNCEDGYVDNYNAGCDQYPREFRTIAPSAHAIRICGTSGWYYKNGYPKTDHDWYEIHIERPNQVDVFCQAEFDCSLWLMDGRGGCSQIETLDYDEGYWCESMASVSADLAEGRYWIVVEYESGTYTCGLGYRLWIDGYLPDPMTVVEGPELRAVRLQTPTPNPSNGTVEIHYDLAEPGHVQVAIHDVSGRLVRILTDELGQPGPGHTRWDGRDNDGRAAASGVYECRVVTRSGTTVRPFLRMR